MSHIGKCFLLFLLCSYALGVPLATTPDWFFGNAMKFQRFSDPFCSILPPNNTSTNIGWFGGLYSFSVPMTREACVKIPSTKIGNPTNTWIKFYWIDDPTGRDLTCHPGSSHLANINLELQYHNTPTCSGSWISSEQIFQPPMNDPYSPGFQPLKDTTACLKDRGDPNNIQFYKVFCDIPKPTSTTYITYNVSTTNNITTFVPTTNNITTFVPSIVKPEDLIPLIKTLMAQNASLFKALEVDTKNTVPVEPNKPPSETKSSAPYVDVGLAVILAVTACLFFFA